MYLADVARRRAGLVPMSRKPVADELLVEAGLVGALLIGIARPEAGRIGGEHLVGQDDLAVDHAELELGVGDDHAAGRRMVAGGGVHGQGQIAQGDGIVVADQLGAAFKRDVLVMVADLGLGGRGEDGLGQLRGIHEALGQRDAAHGALALVLFQTAAGQIPAHDAFHGKHLGLLHQHEAAAQVIGIGLELLGQVGHVGGDEMVVHHAVQKLEPELRQLGEHLALAGNLVVQHVVEGRDAVGSHQQQLVSQIVQVAHLALRVGGDVDSRHGRPFSLRVRARLCPSKRHFERDFCVPLIMA